MTSSNIALSYLLLLALIGFCLWILRNLLRGMARQSAADSPAEPDAAARAEDNPHPEQPLSRWLLRIRRHGHDELPQAQLRAINPAGAFLETSTPLKPGERLLLEMDIPAYGQVQTAAQILWVGEQPPGSTGVQVRFLDLAPAECAELFHLGGERSLLMVREEEQPRA